MPRNGCVAITGPATGAAIGGAAPAMPAIAVNGPEPGITRATTSPPPRQPRRSQSGPHVSGPSRWRWATRPPFR